MPEPVNQDPPKLDLGATLAAVLKRFGDNAEQALRNELSEHHKTRARNRRLKEELAKVRPAEGAVVLTKEEAAEWGAYKKLGKPSEVAKKVTDGEAAATKLAAAEAGTLVERAARAMAKIPGKDGAAARAWNAQVLQELVNDKRLTVELRKQRVDGQDVDAPFVKGPGEGAAFTPLAEFVTSNHKHWLRALETLDEQGPPSDGMTGEIVPFPRQQPSSDGSRNGGGRGKGDVVGAYIGAQIDNLPPGLLPAAAK